MEEKNMRELKLDEMDKVSGGKDELYNGMKFYEMDVLSQKCAREGHCPNCDSEKRNPAWWYFQENKYFYRCDLCGFTIAIQ